MNSEMSLLDHSHLDMHNHSVSLCSQHWAKGMETAVIVQLSTVLRGLSVVCGVHSGVNNRKESHCEVRKEELSLAEGG